jgi:hypothetical protein
VRVCGKRGYPPTAIVVVMADVVVVVHPGNPLTHLTLGQVDANDVVSDLRLVDPQQQLLAWWQDLVR